jgi:opacity protein-like surface antigen
MQRTAVPLAAVAILAAVSSMSAQEMPGAPTTHSVRVGFAGGVIVPRTGATTQSLKTGMQGQGFLLFQLPGGLPAIRANVDYAKMKFDRPSTNTTGDAGDRTIIDGVAGIKLDLVPGPIRPYVMAGVGAFNVKDLVGTTSVSDTNIGVDGGAGVSVKIGRIDAFVETRLQNVWTKKTGTVDAKTIQAFPVSFGILF